MIKTRGFDKFKKKLKNLEFKEYPRAYKAAMYEIVFRTKRESMLRTPVDTGVLKANHSTKVWSSGKNDVKGLVYNTTSYAPYVHEILTNRHPVGEAKFLEKALFTVAPMVSRIMRRWLITVDKGFNHSSNSGYNKPEWKRSIRR